jgi:hypothetical protein
MAYGDGNEQIRRRAWERYIEPQIHQGAREVAVAIKPLMKEMEAEGFTPNRPRQFCTALQKKDFLREKSLAVRVEGPPSGTSTTVVLHYTVLPSAAAGLPGAAQTEERKRRALAAFDAMHGSMKTEIEAFGGSDAFIRWARSEEDEPAA